MKNLIWAEWKKLRRSSIVLFTVTRSFYPITGLLGVAGYYETTTADLIGSIIILLACGCLAVFILLLHRHGGKEESHHGK